MVSNVQGEGVDVEEFYDSERYHRVSSSSVLCRINEKFAESVQSYKIRSCVGLYTD